MMVFDPTKSPVKLTLADFRKEKRGGWRGGGGEGGNSAPSPPSQKRHLKIPPRFGLRELIFRVCSD